MTLCLTKAEGRLGGSFLLLDAEAKFSLRLRSPLEQRRIVLKNSTTARRSQIRQDKIPNYGNPGGTRRCNSLVGEQLPTFKRLAVAANSFSTQSAERAFAALVTTINKGFNSGSSHWLPGGLALRCAREERCHNLPFWELPHFPSAVSFCPLELSLAYAARQGHLCRWQIYGELVHGDRCISAGRT